MAIIKTATNSVVVHGPEAGHDMFVVTLYAPCDGSNLYKRLCVEPISKWQAAVDWAVGMADQMVHPLHVAAIGPVAFRRFYGERIEKGLASMSAAELAELSREMVDTCAEAMRDCPDHNVRADAYDVLVKLGVVQC